MGTFVPSDKLVAAILSDEVYHSNGESINLASSGWVQIDHSYNSQTGYYGEAWAKVDPNTGQYTEIMQVNRGTVVSAPDPNANYAGAPLAENYNSDSGKTIAADALIVLTNSSNYAGTAEQFYQQIAQDHPGLAIIETGQSLGGWTANDVSNFALSNGDNNVSAITFNALPNYIPTSSANYDALLNKDTNRNRGQSRINQFTLPIRLDYDRDTRNGTLTPIELQSRSRSA